MPDIDKNSDHLENEHILDLATRLLGADVVQGRELNEDEKNAAKDIIMALGASFSQMKKIVSQSLKGVMALDADEDPDPETREARITAYRRCMRRFTIHQSKTFVMTMTALPEIVGELVQVTGDPLVFQHLDKREVMSDFDTGYANAMADALLDKYNPNDIDDKYADHIVDRLLENDQ